MRFSSPSCKSFGSFAIGGMAGFAVVAWLSPSWQPPTSQSGPDSLTVTASDNPPQAPWLALAGADRLISCLNFVPSIPARDWPRFFELHQDDELVRPALIQQWSKRDPAGFWAWVLRQRDACWLGEAGLMIFTEWATLDPKAALTAAARIGPSRTRAPIVSRILSIALNRNPAQGLALFQITGPDDSAGYVYNGQNGEWIRKDPVGALHLVLAMPENCYARRNFLLAVLGSWTEQDPEAMLTWVPANSDKLTGIGLSYLFRAAAARMPAETMAAAVAMERKTNRGGLLNAAIAGAPETMSAEELEQLVRTHAGADGPRDALDAVIARICEKEPDKAADLWNQMANSPGGAGHPGLIAKYYAKTDWPAAAEWVRGIKDTLFRRDAWPELALRAPASEIIPLSEHVAALPVEELSDNLLTTMRNALATNPDKAALDHWLATLSPVKAEWVRTLKE